MQLTKNFTRPPVAPVAPNINSAHKQTNVLRVKVKHSIFSGGRNGLQSHVDEEEKARQESGGGESDKLFLENVQISSIISLDLHFYKLETVVVLK